MLLFVALVAHAVVVIENRREVQFIPATGTTGLEEQDFLAEGIRGGDGDKQRGDSQPLGELP